MLRFPSSNGDIQVNVPGLTFPDLPTEGGFAGRTVHAGNIAFANRKISASAQSALIESDTNEGHVLNLYNITDPLAGPPETEFATIIADFDQSGINTLGIRDRVPNTNVYAVDEIRFATSFESAMGRSLIAIPTFALTITPATAPDTGYDLEWDSQPGKLYNLFTSIDLVGAIPTWIRTTSNPHRTTWF